MQVPWHRGTCWNILLCKTSTPCSFLKIADKNDTLPLGKCKYLFTFRSIMPPFTFHLIGKITGLLTSMQANFLPEIKLLPIQTTFNKTPSNTPGGPEFEILPSSEGGVGSVPGWGDKIPCGQEKKNIKQK